MGYDNQEKFEIRDLREKDRFVVDDKFLNGYAKFLGIYAVGVYNSLCRHADRDQKCWPSIKKIVQELNIGRNKVIESTKYLEFWRIIRKERMGLKLTNRYLLLSKRGWKSLDETNLKQFSDIHHLNFGSLLDKLQKSAISTSIVRKYNSKETQKKGYSFSSNSERCEAYGQGKRWDEKPYFRGNPMVWKETKKWWYVIEDNEWKEFSGKEAEIEWKSK